MAGANPKWIEWPKKSLNQICYLDLGYIMLMLTLILYININLHAVLHQNHFDNPVLHKVLYFIVNYRLATVTN